MWRISSPPRIRSAQGMNMWSASRMMGAEEVEAEEEEAEGASEEEAAEGVIEGAAEGAGRNSADWT